ncbi:MAG: bacitracin transport permease BCRC [Microgenomates group bacterium Gr01-1014_7]|nr:MAG: bacitracin transport permease BCRC [Microgenomates group bacterium Gr01-1014_7]
MIFGARFIIYFTFILMFVFFFKGGVKEKKALILATLSIPILVLIIKSVHLLYFEPRPFISYHFSPLVDPVGDASFPSVHASLMAVLAFSFVHFKSKWAPLFLFLMLWVGVSRIYVGVHYPLDILGGFAVGIISLVITKQITKRLKSHFFSQSF